MKTFSILPYHVPRCYGHHSTELEKSSAHLPSLANSTQPLPFRYMAKLTDFQLLCFDVYGTLVDWETGVVSGLQPFLDANKASFSREYLLTVHHDCEAAQQTKTPDMAYARLLTTIHPHIASSLGLPTPTMEQDAAFGASVGKWPAFADTVDALQRLGKQYKLVVLSNVDRKSFEQTLAGPLRGAAFDAVITAQDVGSYKPDRRNFEHLLREVKAKFGVEKGEVLQTAQSQFHDHWPARDMGIRSCWIVRPGAVMGNRNEEVYDWRFDTLGEMADALEEELKSAA